MPTLESQELRDGIRSGEIECYCQERVDGQRKHLNDCQWHRAVHEIYRLERENEGICNQLQRR